MDLDTWVRHLSCSCSVCLSVCSPLESFGRPRSDCLANASRGGPAFRSRLVRKLCLHLGVAWRCLLVVAWPQELRNKVDSHRMDHSRLPGIHGVQRDRGVRERNHALGRGACMLYPISRLATAAPKPFLVDNDLAQHPAARILGDFKRGPKWPREKTGILRPIDQAARKPLPNV